MSTADDFVTALPSTEPESITGGHHLHDTTFLVPAQAQIDAAYDEMAALHVNVPTARVWLTELVVRTCARRQATAAAAAPTAPTPTRPVQPAQPDGFEPTPHENETIHRLLTVAFATVNGRRGRLRELLDRNLATPSGCRGVNAAAELVTLTNISTDIRIRRLQTQVVREPERATFYISSIVGWGPRFRALSATIHRDHHNHYRITGFNFV